MVLAAAATLGGCRAAYVTRLAVEEARWLWNAKPATELLATSGDSKRRRALETLLAVRRFARDEGLDVGGSYRKVADASSASPFHVVTAAWPDRLEAYTWWYPVVGAVPYRGYFDRASAEAFAAGLAREGLDVRIVEASAYSTLGWFDDPLPSSVLDRGEAAVVVTVLHELVHQTVFVPGRVAFNETLATAASWRLAERFHAGRGEAEAAGRMRAARERWLQRGDLLDRAAARLASFFDAARAGGMARDAMLAGRARLYGELLADLGRVDPAYAAELASEGFDNAAFLAEHRYADRARRADALLDRAPSVGAALRAITADDGAGWDVPLQ